MVSAAGGMKSFTPRSTSELRTCLATAGNGALTTAEPTNQAMTSTERTLTAAPPRASTIATGRQVTRERTITPSSEASSWPIIAVMNTRMMATRACCEDPCTRNLATPGENVAPTAAPARNPMQLSTPTMKPCRYPATANAAASTIKIRSSRSPGIHPRYRAGAAQCTGRDRTASWPPPGPGAAWRATAKQWRLAPRGGVEHVRGQVLLPPGIPRLFPPAEREQPVHEQRGEAPYQHAVHPEGGARGAGRMPHAQPVRRVGEVGQPGPGRRDDLAVGGGNERARLTPPGKHGCDPEAAPGDVQLGQHGKDLHPGRVHAHLLGGLTQRGAHRPLIGRLDRAAGEGRLPRMAAQVRPALHDQQIRVACCLPEQEQDRRGPAAMRRGPQRWRHPHLPCPGRQLGEPGRRRAGRCRTRQDGA